MIREKLGVARRFVECFPSNIATEISREVGRKVHQVCSSDEFKGEILEACEIIENIVESVPVVGSIYQYEMGIKNILNVRIDDRKRLTRRVAEILYPEGDPRDLASREKYMNKFGK